ncbi:hypothetical protein D1B33_07395 [Lysinibacillus yapensis]|uniref:Uncharacterized protein n=1 Tax=Ureibacillus yapensis TaxID=2304605 RepID=A0A396SR77_9BACL|nr:hypothetical protein [Lysinibacillus yapensis]RHW38689.1 hypothetical protein D1B33_07395 [Lysinibacillus yapensis]
MSINSTVIENTLEKLALNNEKRFNAYQIASLSNETDVMAVNNYLLYRSDSNFGILNAKIETLCDNNHPDKHFELNEPLPDYELECRICGCEYIPDMEFSHIVFYFKESYVTEVKKKRLNKQLILCLN